METANISPARADRPNVVARPPLILLGSILVGWGAWAIVPIGLFGHPVAAIAGAVLGSAGFALAAACAIRFRAAGTNIRTELPAERLVLTGPYRNSRNPIYVGLVLLHAAIGIGFDNAWTLGLTAVFAVILHVGVIRREEAYLTAKFGDAYRACRTRTRRWL